LAALKDGTLDAIASDHAPHELDSKRIEFSKAAFGITGLQTNLPLILEFVKQNRLSAKRAVEALTIGAAKCFGLEVGTLRKGATADICIIDPEHSWIYDRSVSRSLSANSPFMGQKLCGRARWVLINGTLVVNDYQLVRESP
jgi:dihydroorotase